jgi:hypothetical protein
MIVMSAIQRMIAAARAGEDVAPADVREYVGEVLDATGGELPLVHLALLARFGGAAPEAEAAHRAWHEARGLAPPDLPWAGAI